MLAQYRGSKSRSSLEAASTSSHADDESAPPVLVLPSSTELFYFYASTLDQCASLFTGQPLHDLCTLFKKWLRIYAGAYTLCLDRMTCLTRYCRGGTCGKPPETAYVHTSTIHGLPLRHLRVEKRVHAHQHSGLLSDDRPRTRREHSREV